MSKPIHLLLHGFYIFLAITLGLVIASVPIVYLEAQHNKKIAEMERIEAAQTNIQKLILEQKKQELKNMIDRQLEEMKADEKARKEAFGQ